MANMVDIIKSVTGKTRLLGIVGNPLEHSISPQLHNTLSRHLGNDLIYVPFKVEKEKVKSLIDGLKAIDVLGFNVTVPYKSYIMDFLDRKSEEALLMGAVNTVNNVNGKLYGYNTDGEGFFRSFKTETETELKGKKVVLIGAGGAARAIGVKVAMEGAKEVVIVNRTLSKAEKLAEVINGNICSIANPIGLEEFKKQNGIKNSDIIINTTSVGMYPYTDASPLGDSPGFVKNQVVFDAIYNPPRTKLLLSAEKEGCRTINGFGMLLYQGVEAYEIWTGEKVPEELVDEVYKSFSKYLKII